MSFNPDWCRNESDVESKLIVQYLLPKLGYSPDTWHQEVSFGNIRLDFLVFATQIIPFVLDANSPLNLVIEAKHPKEKLDNHVRRLRLYLSRLNVQYGLLTNGTEIRIYQRKEDDLELLFHCSGKEVDARLDEIKSLIGRDNLKEKANQLSLEANTKLDPEIGDQSKVSTLVAEKKRNHSMKVIAVYHNKGGVGKTTTVVNLAAAIRKKGKKVLVIDMDSQANTTFATGLIKFDDEAFDDIKDSNILHILQSEELFSIQEVSRKSQFTNPEVDVVPSHINLMQYENELNQIDLVRFILREKLEKIKEEYDVVIIDTPPSLNLYARLALIAADYLIIPSDLKPFANQGLVNVKDFIKTVDGFRRQMRRNPIEILGILGCKISTNPKFVQHTLRDRLKAIPKRYGLEMMETIIYEREDLAKCAEKVQFDGDREIADPVSVLDFKPDSKAAQEFELLAMEVLQKIGLGK